MSQIRVTRSTILFVLLLPGAASAGITNGDFSNGFDGWLGEVTNLDFDTLLLDPPPGAFTDNYDASSEEAVLTTTTTDNEIWSVILFQPFFVDPPGPGESLFLSYDLSFAPSGGGTGGLALAQLTSSRGTESLLGMNRLDITDLAGETVEILFGIEDFDDVADVMLVDNVRISGVDVPAPSTVTLLWLGASILLVARRNKRSR